MPILSLRGRTATKTDFIFNARTLDFKVNFQMLYIDVCFDIYNNHDELKSGKGVRRPFELIAHVSMAWPFFFHLKLELQITLANPLRGGGGVGDQLAN